MAGHHHSRLREREAPACPGARVVLVVDARGRGPEYRYMRALCTDGTSRGDSLPAFVHACDRWDSYMRVWQNQIQNHCCRIPLGFDPRFFLVCGIPTFKDDFGLIAE